jgi:Gon7 family
MANLTATYTASAADPKVFEHTQTACSKTPSTEERTAYIASLRSNVSTLQDQVNAFLTEKMEEDKSAAVAAVNDEKEEENYGEEVVD